jgi:hypothetical protein
MVVKQMDMKNILLDRVNISLDKLFVWMEIVWQEKLNSILIKRNIFSGVEWT